MNIHNWLDGRYVVQFIVGGKYCTALVEHAEPQAVFEAVKEWHEEIDPSGSLVPFVVVSDMYVSQDIADWYVENELAQVRV